MKKLAFGLLAAAFISFYTPSSIFAQNNNTIGFRTEVISFAIGTLEYKSQFESATFLISPNATQTYIILINKNGSSDFNFIFNNQYANGGTAYTEVKINGKIQNDVFGTWELNTETQIITVEIFNRSRDITKIVLRVIENLN